MSSYKKKNRRTTSNASLALLKPYLYQNKLLSFFGFVAILTASVVTLLFPVAVRGVLDNGFAAKYSFSTSSFVLLFALAFLLACSSAGRYFCVIMLGEKVIAKLRSDIFAHILNLPISFFDKTESGEIVSRLSSDATQVKEVIGTVSSIALRNLLMGAGALVMMFVTNLQLSLMVVLTVPFIVLILIFFARKVRAKTRLSQDKLAKANALASESISSIVTVQSFVRESLVQQKFSGLIGAAFKESLGLVATRAMLTGFAIFVVFSSVIIVLYIGAYDVFAHKLSAGTLGQFILYAIFSASSFGQLSEIGSQFAQGLGALERLAEIKNEPIDSGYNKIEKFNDPIKGEIIFKNVSFAYPARPKHNILKNFNLKIEAGQKVAFVGATGAGKSTIFSLLLNFYLPQEGSILIDGKDASNISLSELRKNMSYVPQDIAIFNGTIFDNIAFAKPDATFAEIEAAAKFAYAYDFIIKLPKAFETQVGERGIMLSGGQRQRIALSRAFLKDSAILMLDEATSALDAQSEKYIQEALEKLMRNRTTFIIAHRLATVVQADKIFVLENGSIVESGTHQELIVKKGAYARLAELQFNDKVNQLI